MKHLHFIILLFSIILWSSCRKDFDTVPSSGNLEFSQDTVFFDTLFTRIKSSTQQFKVYNRSDEDISIPSISLERGNGSKYQLNVDGLPLTADNITASTGKEFSNIEILAKDSIFIFAEVIVDVDTDILDADQNYNDKILFTSVNGTQEVDLISKVNDANFIFQSETDEEKSFETTSRDDQGEFISITGFDLDDDELIMTNEKAYVIFGNVIVPTGETLIVEAGARLHFHEDSGLFVEPGATVLFNGIGSPEDDPLLNEIIIESDRIAEDFDNLPGQWGFIWIQKGSTGNVMNNTTIKNASLGVLIDGNGDETTPSLVINNVQIYNSQSAGIQANGTYITAQNLVLNRSGQASLNIEQGGTYNFDHCTLVNHFSFGFSSLDAVNLGNSLRTDSNVSVTNLNANFKNCIITGNSRSELNLNESDEAEFNFKFENCLIFASENLNTGEDSIYNFDNPLLYENCIFNEDPMFKNTNLNQLQINEESAANGAAASNPAFFDITGTLRDSSAPDIGAYESIIFEEELEEDPSE